MKKESGVVKTKGKVIQKIFLYLFLVLLAYAFITVNPELLVLSVVASVVYLFVYGVHEQQPSLGVNE